MRLDTLVFGSVFVALLFPGVDTPSLFLSFRQLKSLMHYDDSNCKLI